MNPPRKISILSPTFRCARYVRSCIESVRAQDYPNYEHIFVDGDSRDGTVEILKEYPHLKWVSEPDAGEAQALNKALNLATGEIIGWLNADDVYTPRTLRTVADTFAATTDQPVLYGKMALLTEHDQPIGLRIPVPQVTLHRLLRWYQHLHLYQPTLFFPAEVLRAVGPFREDLKYSVDLEYWLRVVLKGYRFQFIDQVLAKMRLARSDGKSAAPYAAKDRDWLAACLPAVATLPPGERVYFWKDYYTHRIARSSLYGDSPFPPPPDRDAVLGLAIAASDSGALASAAGLLREATARFPHDADLHWLLGESLRESGATADSAHAFAQADAPGAHAPAGTARATVVPGADLQAPAPKAEPTPAPSAVSPGRRALVYCHFNPYPPRSGAHQGSLGVLRGLRALGYEVTLASSDLFTDQPWTDATIRALATDLGITAALYRADDADRQYVQQAQQKNEIWALHTPPGLVRFFRQTFRQLQPDLVLINYAYCEGLLSAAERATTTCVVQMHDLVSLGGAMASLAWPELGRPPFTAAQVKPEFLREDFFFRAGLRVNPEELRRYGSFDGVIAVSNSEAELVRDHAPQTEVAVIPVSLAARPVANTYAEGPLLVIFTNPFNIQGYLYVTHEVLPKWRAQAPQASLRVAGDACRVLSPVPGVQLLGFVPDLALAYAHSKFAICPLLGGTGQQVKILEAMAHGLAVVALRQVAASSPIQHGVNGFVADNADEFAAYMAKLDLDPALCRTMGEAARATVARELSEPLCTRKLGALLEAAQGARARRLAAAPSVGHSAPREADDADRFVMISEQHAGWGEAPPAPADLPRLARHIFDFLSGFGPFYAHFGGAGDALLLLSSFYDDQPESVVVSYANNVESARSLFRAFPRLKKVHFLPKCQDWQMHALLRGVVGCLPNCLGMAPAPKKDYCEEWTSQLDIFTHYRIRQFPEWAAAFRHPSPERWVAVAPKGSSLGTIGSKRLLIPHPYWEGLLAHLRERGYTPVLLGLPAEAREYPALPGCQDCRSESFPRQMEIIGRCRALVGADSWAKTFSALLDLPTFVFEATKGADYLGRKDISDHVFLDPWDAISVIQNLDQFKLAFDRRMEGAGQATEVKPASFTVAWEGSFLDLGSLSHVNRELVNCLPHHHGGPLALVGKNQLPPTNGSAPELRALARRLQTQPPKDSRVTVRHEWPPRWEAPAAGAWVLMQPWEYGSLPAEWVQQTARVDEVWAYSHYVRRVYVNSGVPAAKVKVVPLGINPSVFQPAAAPRSLPTQKSFKFLFVGGTIHRKGPDVLLRAYGETFTAADDVCLVIKDFGGQSVYAGQTLEAHIKALQARPNAPEILYLNEELPPEALPGLYTACQCLVHPYRGEGFGLPVLEAMACGLPVIVTAGGSTDDFAPADLAYRIPACRKEIGQAISGQKLVRPGWLLEPDPVALADRMKWVSRHPAEARELGLKASVHARRDWTWDRSARVVAERLGQLAASATAKPPQRAPRKAAPITLPPCAWVGHLAKARELKNQKKLPAAWVETLEAWLKRPCHPEALLLLAEIALAAGDAESARQCAQRARELAPGYHPARQFLKGKLRGQAHPEWLVVPESLRRPASVPPRVTVCLIVKNEEQFLDQCLRSVKGLADQLVIVDTGSTDRTLQIAQAHAAEIHHFAWCDDFSAARNAALEHATGDWILMLDADEELPPESHERLRKLLVLPAVMAWRLPIIDVGREAEGCSYVPRLFRNGPGLFFVGRVHEQVFSSIEVRRKEWGLENRLGDAPLRHHGYTKEMTRARGKIERNLRLLEKAIEELPDEPSLLMNYGLELVRSGDLPRGLDQYRAAFQIMSGQGPELMVPELRETLLTQFCTYLMRAKRLDELVRVLTSPLALNPGLTASLHFALGLAYIDLQQAAPAAEQMRQCLAKRDRPALAPINADIRKAGPRHCLALCLARMGEHQPAETEFQAALKEDPASIPVRIDLARFLMSRSRPVEALELLHSTVQTYPQALPAWLCGGDILLSQPEFLEIALDWTAEALRLFPAHEAIRSHRSQTLLLAGQPAEALTLLAQQPNLSDPALLAARLICETVTNIPASPLPAPLLPTVTKEFLNWYQRLLRYAAHDLVTALNARVEPLARSLPEAARLLQAAIQEVAAAPTAGA